MVSIFSDASLKNKEDDELGFRDSANGIITTIESVSEKDTPFTIAIFGPWGSGKTSLMKIMEDLLTKKYKTIFFNSWEYGNEEKLWIPFMITVVDELFEETIDKTELMKNIFLFSTDVVLQIYSQGRIPTGGILDLIKKTKKTSPFKEWSDEDTNIVIERVTKIKEFRKKIEEKTANKKVIIFIDDLDRIPEKSVDFLNSLKTFFDIKGCIFIIGCDYKILKGELKNKYSSDIYEDYFDKIVQSEFYIPRINEQAINGYLRFLTDWSEVEIEKCTQLINHSIGGNPRKIKRATNATVFIRNVFESKLTTILQEFERPKLEIKREITGNEDIEEPEDLKGEITRILNPTIVFKVLFKEIVLFKLVCLRKQWFNLYESILSDKEKQHTLISLQEDAETGISELIKENEEKLQETKKNLPEFLNKEPNFEGVEDLTTYLNLLGISSPELGFSPKYPEPEKLSDKVFNRFMVFERINKGKVEKCIIKNKINKMDWKSDLDSIYFFIEVILSFRYNDLIKLLLTNKKTIENIADKFRESKDSGAVGRLLESVNRIDKVVAKRLLDETKNTYADKIRESKDPGAVGRLLESVNRIDDEVAKRLLDETKNTYADKIRESKDPGAVGRLLESVNRIDDEVAKRLLDETKDTYADKIRESKDPGAVGWLLESVSGMDNEVVVAKRLLDETKDTYADKIRESKDPRAVGWLLNSVKRIDKVVAKRLLDEIKDWYADKIRESKDPGAVGRLLESVNRIDDEVAKRLLAEIKDWYADKIRESKDPRAVGRLLESVSIMDNEVAKRLLDETKNTYADKIRESKDPGAVGRLLESVYSMDNEVARRLLAETKDTYVDKIRESKDPVAVGRLLKSVSRVDNEVARRLLAQTKDIYADKIRESKDPGAVRWLLKIVGAIDKETANRLRIE